jgi:hypothetical protein
MSSSEQKGNPPVVMRPGKYVRLSPLRVFGVLALLVLPWVIVVSQSITQSPAARSAAAPPPAVPQTSPASAPAPVATTNHVLPPGPWGELEYTPITLEPPADSVERFAAADTGTWYFRDTTGEQLPGVLRSAGLTEAQVRAMVRACAPDPEGNGVTVRPDPDTLAAISYDARSALYTWLARDPRNPQSEPFRHHIGGAPWLADSGLPGRTVALLRTYFYRRGEWEAFSDISAVLPEIPEAEDRAKMFRALASQAALNVRLRVRPDSDLPALIEYWGRGHRERDIGPLLESLAKVPGGDTVGVSQLLPAFARARLNTFPPRVNLDGSVRGVFDCHWTSLNFWNAMPENRFTEPPIAAHEFETAYREVERPTQFGDVILLTNAAGQGIHSAVYIAGDVVFTKNGVSIAAPWIFMRLGDVVTYYEMDGAVKQVTYRRRDLE